MYREIIFGKFLFLFSLSEDYILAVLSELAWCSFHCKCLWWVLGTLSAARTAMQCQCAASATNVLQQHKRQFTCFQLLSVICSLWSRVPWWKPALSWLIPLPVWQVSPSTMPSGALCLHAAIYAADARSRPDALRTNTTLSEGLGVNQGSKLRSQLQMDAKTIFLDCLSFELLIVQSQEKLS